MFTWTLSEEPGMLHWPHPWGLSFLMVCYTCHPEYWIRLKTVISNSPTAVSLPASSVWNYTASWDKNISNSQVINVYNPLKFSPLYNLRQGQQGRPYKYIIKYWNTSFSDMNLSVKNVKNHQHPNSPEAHIPPRCSKLSSFPQSVYL